MIKLLKKIYHWITYKNRIARYFRLRRLWKFNKFTFPLVKQMMPKLLTEELIAVQPMRKPVDSSFTFEYKTGPTIYEPLTFGGFDFAWGRFYIDENGQPIYSKDKDYDRVRQKVIEKKHAKEIANMPSSTFELIKKTNSDFSYGYWRIKDVESEEYKIAEENSKKALDILNKYDDDKLISPGWYVTNDGRVIGISYYYDAFIDFLHGPVSRTGMQQALNEEFIERNLYYKELVKNQTGPSWREQHPNGISGVSGINKMEVKNDTKTKANGTAENA